MIPPYTSLVKYENPVLISRTTDKKDPKNKVKKPAGLPSMTTSAALSSTAADPVPSPTRGGKLPPVSPKNGQSANSEIEEILNSIVPPREVTEGGQLFIQSISSTPATRMEVIALQELLDQRLHQRQARETGICPVRRELYSQAFDELIRQVAINCAERGLLLLRVRDEMRMTLAAYQTLYESSVAFGMRKAMMAEQGKADMETKITTLEREKAELEAEVARLKARADEIERREQERRLTDQRKHEEELQFLKRTNQQLKTQLENILAPPKK